MASDSLKGCLTCFRQTENFLSITEGSDDQASEENVEAVFTTHFWFTKAECHGRIVCTSCWEKIDDFHKFYCDVKKVHLPVIKQELEDALEGPMVQGKVEGNESDRLLYTEVVCKLEEEKSSASEPEANDKSDNESSSSSESESTATTTSDSDSDDVPLAKRTKRKRKRRTRTNIELNCCLCADEGTHCEPFYTWYKLNVHFKQVHNQNGFMYCCSKRFVKKPLYLKHIKDHGRTAAEQKHCLECKCSFKDESGLARHMIIFHTPEEEKQFKCDRCEKAFPEEDLLKSHISWHNEVEQLNHHCAICNRYFTGAGLLRTHNENHHSTTPAGTAAEGTSGRRRSTPEDIAKQDELISKFVTMNCSKCDFVGENFKALSSHAKNVHNMPTYSVICCERKFSKRFRLYEHCLRHLNPDHFKCELCDKTFTDSDGLQSHRWFIHTPVSERPFKCDVCGDAYVKEYLLKAHMDRHLDKERKTHTCDTCGVAYTTMPQLKAHQQNVHGAMSDWVCDVCAKGFAHRALLERHRLTHTEEGLASLKEQCEKCHKWLINRTSYLRHRKLCGNSTGPAKCDLCEHVSVNAHALSVHKKLNHTDRPKYACTYCGKEFKKQLRLKEHEANHAGIVLYKCPFCPRMCNSSSNMYTHKKTAHAEQWAAVVAAKHSSRDGP